MTVLKLKITKDGGSQWKKLFLRVKFVMTVFIKIRKQSLHSA